jgi:hypothetical protein
LTKYFQQGINMQRYGLFLSVIIFSLFMACSQPAIQSSVTKTDAQLIERGAVVCFSSMETGSGISRAARANVVVRPQCKIAHQAYY